MSTYLLNLLCKKFKQREDVNYRIYCCDWTAMNLRYKKLMILTMRMNDAIKMTIRATPVKTINLQLFVSVTNIKNIVIK